MLYYCFPFALRYTGQQTKFFHVVVWLYGYTDDNILVKRTKHNCMYALLIEVLSSYNINVQLEQRVLFMPNAFLFVAYSKTMIWCTYVFRFQMKKKYIYSKWIIIHFCGVKQNEIWNVQHLCAHIFVERLDFPSLRSYFK